MFHFLSAKFFSDVGDSAKKYKLAIFKPKISKFWIFWPSSYLVSYL